MRKTAIFIALVLLLALGVTPALAAGGVPKIPHAFFGSVIVNGAAAADGTQVSATVNIGTIISTQNPVTTVGGSYGISNPYLLVQGYDIPDGTTINFYVNGVSTGQTASFIAGGGPTQEDLSATITGGGGGGGTITTTVVTNFFGTQSSFELDSSGIVQGTFTATSLDGKLTINIPKGTKALDKNGNPLTNMTAAVFTNPPPPPANANIIGLTYDFGPAGATFNPLITFTWNYDPAALPAGVAAQDLVIAYYDTATGKWVELQGAVNTTNHTVTALVSHFTTFVMLGP